jgi:hypothetical protein
VSSQLYFEDVVSELLTLKTSLTVLRSGDKLVQQEHVESRIRKTYLAKQLPAAALPPRPVVVFKHLVMKKNKNFYLYAL